MGIMTDRKFVLGALTWSLAILLAAYLYRVLITDPHFEQSVAASPSSVVTQTALPR